MYVPGECVDVIVQLLFFEREVLGIGALVVLPLSETEKKHGFTTTVSSYVCISIESWEMVLVTMKCRSVVMEILSTYEGYANNQL